MYYKQLIPVLIYVIAFGNVFNVLGQDTIPPKITIAETQIRINYPLGDLGLDVIYPPISNDTLEVTLSCIYLFPESYYFKLENAFIEDDSGTYKDTVIVDNVSFYENGYGTVIQTIIAEDNAGNTSKFVIKSTLGPIYFFDFRGMIVGGINVPYNNSTHTLETTDFEFCKGQNIEVKAYYSKNGCTGNTRIDWYKDNDLVLTNSDGFIVNIGNESGGIELAAEGKYSNTNFEDRIKIKLRPKIANNSNMVIYHPTCLNSGDGSISLESNVENVKWEYNNSSSLYLTSLNPDSYYVSYIYNGCNVNDTITLVPKNILDFAVSDTIIDLTQNEILTIHNLSKGFDRFWWQIGDSIFTNILDEFDYNFSVPGKYVIKLTDNIGSCNDTIYKSITVEESTFSNDYLYSSIKIGPNPFKDFIIIDFAKSSDFNLKILGVDGRVYLTDQISDARNFKVDLRFLNSGVYVLKITSPYENNPDNDFKIVKLTGD